MEGPGQDFADVLRGAIRDRGLPLDRLQQRLAAAGTPVSIATLSYWQTGRSIPFRSKSLAALGELERALDVNPGFLTRLLDDARSSRTLHRLEGQAKTLPMSSLATNLVQSIGLSFSASLRTTSMHTRLHIGPDRTETREDLHIVLTAHRQEHQAFPVVQRLLAEEHVTPRVEPGTGFVLGRTISLPERQLLVAELLLRKHLLRGESALAEYSVHYPPVATPTTLHERTSTRGFRELALQVDFAPSVAPSRVYYAFRANYDDPPAPETYVDVQVVGDVAQIVMFNVNAGIHGLYWSWD